MESNQGFCSWLTCRFLCPLLLLDLAQQVCWTLEKWFEFELSKTWKLDYSVFVFLLSTDAFIDDWNGHLAPSMEESLIYDNLPGQTY